MNDKIQIGHLLTCNFEDGNMIFEMETEMKVKAGRYAIIDITKMSLMQLQKFNEFIERL